MEIKINFRIATLDDIEVLEHWDKQQHVIDCAPNEESAWFEEIQRTDEWQDIWIAQLDSRPIGVVQIIDPALEETHYWGEIGMGYRAMDIWIGEAEDLNKGYGTQMMHLSLEKCFANPSVHTVIIDPLESNTKAIRFYERIGFKFLEKRRFDKDDCLVYEIKRDDWL
jgi:aminoglycoside 6'-N-acetyltransferase